MGGQQHRAEPDGHLASGDATGDAVKTVPSNDADAVRPLATPFLPFSLSAALITSCDVLQFKIEIRSVA
jgi:hypothetical protein